MRKRMSYVLTLATLLAPATGLAQMPGLPGAEATDLEGVLVENGEGVVPFRCPIDRIRAAYQTLANPDDALMALAIEKQTLAICRQSQEALIEIAENEMRLRELFGPIMNPSASETPEAPIAQIFAPAPARNVVESPEINASIPFLPLIDTPVVETPETVVEEPPAPETDFVLSALMRDPEGRKAILVRGDEMFTVREGERVDGGTRLVSINEVSVTIVDADGNEFLLE